MELLKIEDLVNIAEYETHRKNFRQEIMDLKKHRRISVGEFVTLVFENRETMKFQVQEMMRAERIVEVQRIEEEIDTYNQLVPGENQLKATLFIEVTEQELIKPTLNRFQGIDRGGTTFLAIGDELVEAEYEGGRSSEIKLSAVHYLTFQLSLAQINSIRNFEIPASIKIFHPSADYIYESSINEDLRRQLANDLSR